MFEGQIAKAVGSQVFPEKDLQKIVHSHAKVAAIVVGFPAFGLDFLVNIAFIFILWDMYSDLCKKANTKLTFNNVLVGIIVNYAFVALLDSALAFLPVIGWFTSAAIVYAQFYFSGKTYIETLKTIYKPSQKPTTKFDIPSKFQVSSNATPLPESTSKISLPEKPAQQILDALRENQKLLAVKYATELYKLPLKEAKDFVDGIKIQENASSATMPIPKVGVTQSVETAQPNVENTDIAASVKEILTTELQNTRESEEVEQNNCIQVEDAIDGNNVQELAKGTELEVENHEVIIEEILAPEIQIVRLLDSCNAREAYDLLQELNDESLKKTYESRCIDGIEQLYSQKVNGAIVSNNILGARKYIDEFTQKYRKSELLEDLIQKAINNSTAADEQSEGIEKKVLIFMLFGLFIIVLVLIVLPKTETATYEPITEITSDELLEVELSQTYSSEEEKAKPVYWNYGDIQKGILAYKVVDEKEERVVWEDDKIRMFYPSTNYVSTFVEDDGIHIAFIMDRKIYNNNLYLIINTQSNYIDNINQLLLVDDQSFRLKLLLSGDEMAFTSKGSVKYIDHEVINFDTAKTHSEFIYEHTEREYNLK